MPRIVRVVVAGYSHHIPKEGIIGKIYSLIMSTKKISFLFRREKQALSLDHISLLLITLSKIIRKYLDREGK